MTLVKNVDCAIVDLEFTQGDTIDMTFTVELNDVAYDMTGMQVDVHFRRQDGVLVKELTSAGLTAEITILTNTMTWLDDGFDYSDTLEYDVQTTDAGVVKTIMKGRAIIKKEQTR